MEKYKKLLPQYVIYEDSRREKNGSAFFIVRDAAFRKYLLVDGPLGRDFEGNAAAGGLKQCPLIPTNAVALRYIFPDLRPQPANRPISFGFGDRLGIATPAHVACVRARTVFPVFGQQSTRENSRTNRSLQDVVDEAGWGCLQAGWRDGWGADADHLKNVNLLREAAAAGYSMFTIDLSDHIKNPAGMSPDEIAAGWNSIPDVADIEQMFSGREYVIDGEKYRFSPEETNRAIVTFAAGLDFAAACYRRLKESLPVFDFEISVDETGVDTTVIDHIFVTEYLRKNNVRFTSLAPKFPGEFEKALDYKGDIREFEKSFQRHAAVCRFFGGYRLSLHSGSDKFAVYPVIGRNCASVHVKTAGTSWLQAARALAVKEPDFYRKIHRCALENIGKDRVGYVVHLDLNKIPALDSVPDEKLPEFFDLPDSRQLIHITYGSILKNYRPELYQLLYRNEDEHYRQVSSHLDRHLDLLTAGKAK